MDLDRSMFYYRSTRDDTAVEEKLLAYSVQLSTRGFPEYYKRIRKEGLVWNHKRVRRIYKKLGLAMRRKTKRRLPQRPKEPLLQPIQPNVTWSMDFMHDSLASGRRFRTLNIIDDYNREVLALEVGYSFPAEHVVRILTQLVEWRGKPLGIRTDNGPEFQKVYEAFCEDHQITPIKIQPGKPVQNGYVERFNRTYREDVLDAYWFDNLQEVRQVTEHWVDDYNNNHPHAGLGGMTPKEFMAVNSGKHQRQGVG
jgi:putative transposase